MNVRLEHAAPVPPVVTDSGPAGAFVLLEGEPAYRISGVDALDPFLVNLASDTDLWMFITSSGGLTAGRVDADGSLFPYVTSDRLHDGRHTTGPVTVLRIARESGPPRLWEPFSDGKDEDAPPAERNQGVERRLYKNLCGNRIVFEEVDHEAGLTFRYRWAGCDAFGWVRTVTLENGGKVPLQIGVLDGLRNILPFGAPLALQQQASNLVDAYKKSEIDPSTGLGIFSQTAGITDRPEALEVLRANTVWCCGLKGSTAHLSLEAIDAFRQGRPEKPVHVLNGRRGNYLVSARVDLEPGQAVQWHVAADAGRDHVQIAELRRALLAGDDPGGRIDASLRAAGDNLRRNVASADGLQLSGRPESWWHHFANVLYNNMRGGVFVRNNDVPAGDFLGFLRARNRAAAERAGLALAGRPERLTVRRLGEIARETGDADLVRLSRDYLPLTFGRRHGDPSRPWNRFEIRVRDRNGDPVLYHEGNWRDIFQNWEALGTAFPRFVPNMVSHFVSASTVDGFNPYRVTRDGVDWEVPAPDDPWSNIGYWGDHQIAYLLRLLEAMDRHDPSALPEMLGVESFAYADVPYRIKPYEDILRNPGATIVFDAERARRIDDRVGRMGTDGKLLAGPDGGVYHANLLEKLLVPALSKLSNLIPGAGIWMNTQRPEWNDANNALGGGGVSVVTLCYLRRYLAFLAGRLAAMSDRQLSVSAEVVAWLDGVAGILEGNGSASPEKAVVPADGDRDPRARRQIMDALGGAFSAYREAVYAWGFSGRRELATRRVAAFCRKALEWVDRSIAANRREDGLYHSYNQLQISAGGGVAVTRLQLMLEGQVAALSSGAIQPAEGLAMLERLFSSELYRADQKSFLLYPERELPGFLEKNVVPDEGIAAIPLLGDLLAAGNRALLQRDADGVGRFHGEIRSARDVDSILDDLAKQPEWMEAVVRDRAAVLDLFEKVFRHRSYLGRAAVMYAYEGIGCIYWHMVAKLLLAVQETLAHAEASGASAAVRDGLAEMYFRVRSGIGCEKRAYEFGAFPTDPYSHTPPSGGAKQPGMTGQVKEEIITRLGELGVGIEAGAIRFRPRLLRADEFLEEPAEFRYVDVEGRDRTLSLPAGSLAFTLCQVPVVYERVEGGYRTRVAMADGSRRETADEVLDAGLAAEVFDRSGRIDHIWVGIPDDAVCKSRSAGAPSRREERVDAVDTKVRARTTMDRS